MLQSQGVLYVTTVDEDIKERESSQSIFALNICLHLVTAIDQINLRTNIQQFPSPSTLESNHTGKSVLQQFVFNFQQCYVSLNALNMLHIWIQLFENDSF